MNAPIDNPETGQFHGGVDLRRQSDSAVYVRTSPAENAQQLKTWHYHEHAYFWMLLNGECSEEIEGGIERHYKPLTLTYHPQGEVHSHKQGSYAPTGLGIILADEPFERIRQFAKFTDEPRVLEGPHFRSITHRINREMRSEDSASQLALEALCLELIVSSSRLTLPKESRPPRWLLLAKDLLHERFAESLRLGEIADSVGIHPAHLGSEFLRHYGCTPGQFIRTLRIQMAERELLADRLTVAEVAQSCGFYDEAHFCKAFKAALGLTPTEFRRSRTRN